MFIIHFLPFNPVDSSLDSSNTSPTNSSSSSSFAAALSSSTTSTYANSTWGAGSGSSSSTQGCGKVIVDGTDLADWPTILGAGNASSDEGAGGTQELSRPGNNNNSSASWCERNVQLKEGAAGGGPGNTDNPPSSRSSSLSPSSSLNECVQSSGGVWGSTSTQLEAGLGSAAFYNSKVSHPLSRPQESTSDGGGVPSASFNPSVNPSAWPALVQGGTSSWPGDGLPSHLSDSSFSASAPVITSHPLSPVNPTGLLQQHTDSATGARSSEQQHFGSGERQVAGPKQGTGSERGCAVASAESEGDSSLSSVSPAVASSWRSMPPVSSDHGIGAPPSDGWGVGGTVAQVQEGSAWGSSSHGGGTEWGKENNDSNTPAVSQGACEGSGSEADWGGAAGGASSSGSEAGGTGEGSCKSGGGDDGGGVSEDSTSPKTAVITKAWDNQKGTDGGDGSVGEWGSGLSVAGELSSSSGGGSITGSGEGESEGTHGDASSSSQKTSKTSNAEVALLGMLNRSDLDPRVLSNTGWGQIQIRQNVAWDFESGRGSSVRNERGASSANTTTAGHHPNAGSMNTEPPAPPPGHNSSSAKARDGWDSGKLQSTGNSHPGGTSEEEAESSKNKVVSGWGELPPPSKGWGGDEPQWGDHRSRGGNWGDAGEQGSSWADGREDKAGRPGGWKAMSTGETGSWRGQSDGGGGDWAQRDSVPSGGGGNSRNLAGGSSDKGSSWGNLDEGGLHRGGWGGGDARGAKPHPDWGSTKPHIAAAAAATAAQIPNSQVAPMKAPNQQQHQSQGQQAQGGPVAGGWNTRSSFGGGASPSKNQNQSAGWTSGSIPQISAGGVGDSLEPSGWEEPSPQSISRKMEIDDGTSAWGDPSRYNSKNVNLWDKNSGPANQGHGQQAVPPMQQQPQPPRRQHSMQHNRDANPSNTAVSKYDVINKLELH